MHKRTRTSACVHVRAKSLHARHLKCTVRRVHRLAWRLGATQRAHEQVHDAYGKKDLAPAAQRTRMLELCLGSNSWVLTAATSAPGPGRAPACICTGTAHMRPHQHRDWAHPSHICTGTELAAAGTPPGGAEHLGGGAAALDGNVCHAREVPRSRKAPLLVNPLTP